ncbi:Imm10 family immunity protein [Fibrella aquatilis]|uniref:Uncharacterized protein n=1 Tax=Fibrella aquatilis TaxID=2817059 RepID=A0A939GCK0_9BACT|nr:Imm10 family immunity protein [Fibrella aquatilis]MBO0934097.1 hypothetical protein [Fibrella aquatilis]
MNVKFQANTVSTVEENEVLTVGFVDNEQQPAEQFMLQSSHFEKSDQPIYCERNDQIQGCYDGVEQVVIERTRIHIWLNKAGTQNLECAELEIYFDIDDTRFGQLVLTLQQILAKSSLVINSR